MLPWLAILGLLALPVNRSSKAWWIWVPLAGFGVLTSVLTNGVIPFPTQALDYVVASLQTVMFGLAAVWLIPPARRLPRKKSILRAFAIYAIAGCLVVARGIWLGADYNGLVVAFMIVPAALVTFWGLVVGGAFCRRHYHPARLVIGTLLALPAISFLLVEIAYFSVTPGGYSWVEKLGMGLVGAGVMAVFCGAILLPFLVLAFRNDFYHERLKAMLGLGVVPPPLPTVPAPPSPPVEQEAGAV